MSNTAHFPSPATFSPAPCTAQLTTKLFLMLTEASMASKAVRAIGNDI
ncbi:hypothetical protein ACFW96_28960 [Streptomyces gardneri]